jgi:hypothetical protein
LSDVFAIQDQIVTAVVAALEIELAPDEQKRLASRSTASCNIAPIRRAKPV